MSELFSIQLQNRQQQGRDGVWLDLPTTTEQLQAALRQIGISSDNPQGLFISGYFAEEEKRFAIPYNMVLASSVDELNFLAARLETLSTGERAELNAALQAPQSELFSIGRITDFPENVEYYVYLPDVRGPAQLGDYSITQKDTKVIYVQDSNCSMENSDLADLTAAQIADIQERARKILAE